MASRDSMSKANNKKRPAVPAKLRQRRVNDPQAIRSQIETAQSRPGKVGLTATGADWLTTALDPFHDRRRASFAGYPDCDPAATVVQEYSMQLDLSAPGAGEWDAHIFVSPMLEPQSMSVGTTSLDGGGLTQIAPAVAYTQGFVNVIAATSGQPLFIVSEVTSPVDYYNTNLSLTAAQVNGKTRVIAAGIEVVNTTPEMYKGGTATTYRLPSYGTATSLQVGDSTPGNLLLGNVSGMTYSKYPYLKSQVMPLKNTVTWSASDGVYMPIPINAVENPLQEETSKLLSFGGANKSAKEVHPTLIGAAAETSPRVPMCANAHIQPGGIFLTGLSNQSTFTITVKVFLEKAPDHYNAELAVLATPGAPYDPVALKLYSSALALLPIATAVGNNANGDWFKKVLQIVRKIASPVFEFAPGFGKVGRVALDVADDVFNVAGKYIKWLP